MIDPRLGSHPIFVRKYLDQNGLATMLATKWLAGVAPEVNLRILLHAGDEACNKEDPPWL